MIEQNELERMAGDHVGHEDERLEEKLQVGGGDGLGDQKGIKKNN